MATRRERVILELEDNFTTGMARAAASAALLNRELDSLSRDSVRTRSAVSDIDRPIQNVGRSSGSTSREVDKLSGRMRILADVAAILGPSLVPIGAVGVPAITGLTAQLGFAATAGATAVLAFQGVGDALKALNAAALDPTTANLDKAHDALERLGPDAQAFVSEVGKMIPELRKLRDVAAGGMFPGLTAGLDAMETALPHVQGVIAAVSQELGNIAADAGQSLASDRWTDFLDFVAREAPPALADMATAAGNTAHAVAALWMATDPLNDDFSKWLVEATADIDRWATGLSKTQGFADFIAYVESNGPKVAAALGAIANAAIQILQAMAPLGGPVLEGIKALADVVSAIADSDIGTPLFTAAAALALFNRTMAVTSSIQKGTLFGASRTNFRQVSAGIRGLTTDLALMNRTAAAMPAKGFIGPLTEAQASAQAARGRLTGTLANIGKATALMGGLAVASTGAADKIGLTNTVSLALMGTIGGPWGAAIGGGIGLMLDAAHASGQWADELKRADAAMNSSDISKMSAAVDELRDKQEAANRASRQAPPPRAQNRSLLDAKALGEKADEVQRKLDMTRATQQQSLLAAGFRGTAAGIDRAAQSTEEFQRDLEKLNQTLSGRADMRDFEASVDDFTKSLKDNGKTLDINTEKGRNNQAALDAIASTALKVAQNLSGAQRVGFLDAARADFVKAARAAGMAKDEAQKLADKVLGLKNVKGQPRIVIDANGAWRVITETQRRIANLRDKEVHINVVTKFPQGRKNFDQFLDIHGGTADGGTIQGARYPYGDKVLVPLAPTEEVTSNRYGQADAFRPELKDINAGMSRAAVFYRMLTRGLADGGTVAGSGTTRTAAAFQIPSVTVLFPSPSQLQSAVRAAEQVAAASAKTARTAADIRQDHLDDLHTQQQIRDLQRELEKTGKKRLKGLDRRAAIAELADAKAQLQEIRRRAKEALAEARQAAIEAQQQARADTLDTLNGNFDLLSRGLSPARAQVAVEQQISNIAQYGQTVARLKAAGASPSLLRQVVAHAEAGDFRSAIRFGQALLANPAALGQLNASLATLDRVTGSVATLTTDPRFLSAAAWNPTAVAPRVVQVNLVADPSAMLLDLQRTIQHEISVQLQASMS